MADSFADLWNSAAPSKPNPPPQKLGSLSTQTNPSHLRRPQNDIFLQLSSACSSSSNSRSATPALVSKPAVKSPVQTASNGDAFSGLFGAGSSLATNRSAANMTIAERAALVEQERINSLLQQHHAQQKQTLTPSAWEGLDSLGSKNFATSAPKPKDEDDWGLGDFAAAAPVASASSSNALLDIDDFSAIDNASRDPPAQDLNFGNGTDDILGDLSRPVESIQRERQHKATTPPRAVRSPVSRTHSPPPHVLGQLIEMGFSITQARTALASTASGQDVQAALEILIANGAASVEGSSSTEVWDSDDEERGFAEGRSERRQSPSPLEEPKPKLRMRRDRQIAQQKQLERERNTSSPSSQQGGLQAEKILAQASEIGFSLFNRANAVWKEGRERVQKVYEERIAAGSDEGLDSHKGSGHSTPTNAKPKWMQDGFTDVEEVPTSSRKLKPKPARESSPQLPPEEVDLFSNARSLPTASTPSVTGVYVSKFRHSKPTPQSISPAPPPAPHLVTTVSAPSSAISLSQQSKLSGTDFFKLGDFPAAETAYTRAIDALPTGHAFLIPLYNNRALVRLKVGDVNGVVGDTGAVEELIGGVGGLREELRRGNGGKILIDGQEEINLGDALVKAWKRRAEALEGREKWEEAGKDWEKIAGAEWAGQNIRGEGVRGGGRCRKMYQQGSEQSKPKPKPKPARRVPTPPSQALDSLRAANEAAELEDSQRHVLKDSVEARLLAWKGGKETNIRALLASLDTILWPELGLQKLSMAELISEGQVKVKYMKSIAKVHPDKLNASNSTVEQRMIAGGVFGALNEAWNASKL